MAKTIAVIGTTNNLDVQQFITKEVSLFINETLCFKELEEVANSYIKPIDGKIMSEQITDYVNKMASTNLKYNFKIGIITNFELLSVANQNKLLKTIEDSSENTIQIIICKTEQKMISTIKSRVVTINMRQEELIYDCLNEEKEFYQKIITNQEELDLIAEFNDIKLSLIAIYNYLNSGDTTSAFIIYTTRFSEYNKIINQLVLRIIYSSLYQNQKFHLLKDLLKYEERLMFNLNERLQIESIFVEINKEQNNG